MRRLLILSALCAFATSVAAAELPPRKPGLWELKMNFARNAPPQAMQQCIDAATDKLMRSPSGRPGAEEDCSKRDISTNGDQTIVDSVCTYGGKTMNSHMVITGSFDSSYVMNITTKSEGALAPGEMSELSMTLQGKWLGPCAADQKPGDMILPGGTKMNVLDLQRRGQGGAGGPPAR
ncbi:MAG: DUF3617 domain-containing protein [Xanthobacteraceae bacterium]